MTYCKRCDREVEGVKPFSYLWAFFWVLMTWFTYGILGLFGYVLYWDLKAARCPICNSKLNNTATPRGRA